MTDGAWSVEGGEKKKAYIHTGKEGINVLSCPILRGLASMLKVSSIRCIVNGWLGAC